MLLKTPIHITKLIDYVNSLDLSKHSYNVKFEKLYNNRTLNQNNYYWLCMGIISSESGYTSYELHESFKKLFIKFFNEDPEDLKSARIQRIRIEKDVMGTKFQEQPTTTELDTVNFAKYMDCIMDVAKTFNIKLPSPDAKDLEEVYAFYSQYYMK